MSVRVLMEICFAIRCRSVEEITIGHVTFLERGGRLARL